MKAPIKVKQKQSGFCYAACLQSLDNSSGGKYNQDDSGIDQKTGWVRVNSSRVRWRAVKSAYYELKSTLDAGSYCLVYITGKYRHWVVAYAADAPVADKIYVMDPYRGEYITLQRAMQIHSAYTLTEVRRVVISK